LQRQDEILTIERKYMDFLVEATLTAASLMESDFGRANDLLPFWINYPPKQRGRAPTGASIPWGEVGEKSLSANLLRAILDKEATITFPGLPFGGDVRFAGSDALIHFDVKLTGPNDRTDEVVAPPQQISGDGARWQNGILNTPFLVTGSRSAMNFQPKLPPFYLLDGTVRPCLTYFLKAVYTVREFGVQPLHYLEVACVPNGLLLFDGPKYARTPGLLIPGKDDQTKPEEDKRVRVRLNPLSTIGNGWRCQQILLRDRQWLVTPRQKPD
jgi:hypothetical protein